MDTGQWDADDSRYNNWTEFSAEALAFATTAKIDKDDAAVITRLVDRGNSNPNRQSRCTQSIRTILIDYPNSPFKAVEEPPYCWCCGEKLSENSSDSEGACNDCSSTGCDWCGKTITELGVYKEDFDMDLGCYECSNYRCQECMVECDMCSEEVCKECIYSHQEERCEERAH